MIMNVSERRIVCFDLNLSKMISEKALIEHQISSDLFKVTGHIFTQDPYAELFWIVAGIGIFCPRQVIGWVFYIFDHADNWPGLST